MKKWQKKWLIGFRWTSTALMLISVCFLLFSMVFGFYMKLVVAAIVALLFFAWVEVSIDDYLIKKDPPPLWRNLIEKQKKERFLMKREGPYFASRYCNRRQSKRVISN